jgi:hypothetical protein
MKTANFEKTKVSQRQALFRPWKVGSGLVGAAIAVGWSTQLVAGHRFNQAEQAYQNVDCKQAIAKFDAMLTSGQLNNRNDAKAKALAHKAECEYYLSLPPAAEVASAVVNAHDLSSRYPDSPLGDSLKQQALSLFRQTTLEKLATVPVCDRLPTLMTQAWLPQPETTDPELTYLCGQTYLTQKSFKAAIVPFQFFLANYPNHKLTPMVETGYAQTVVAHAKASGAGELPPPNATGYTENGDTVVAIANDSPETLRIIFSGPDPRFEELPPCKDCQVYTTEPSGTCPETAPSEIYRLAPGDYQVLVRSTSDQGVMPFTGEWTLAQGNGYSQCFFISSSTQLPNSQSSSQSLPIPLNDAL